MVRQKNTDTGPLQSNQSFTPTGPTNSGPGNAVLPNPKNGATTGSQQEAAKFPGGILAVDVGAAAAETNLVKPGTRFDTSTNYQSEVSVNSRSMVGSASSEPDPALINRGYTEVPGAVNVGQIPCVSENRSRFITPDGDELSSNGGTANVDHPLSPPSVQGPVPFNPTKGV